MPNITCLGDILKKEGYKNYQAGAIEAVISTGGQIMPPVMGAAAFIMAEIIGKPYTEIMKAGIVPALLFFISTFFVVHFQAKTCPDTHFFLTST